MQNLQSKRFSYLCLPRGEMDFALILTPDTVDLCLFPEVGSSYLSPKATRFCFYTSPSDSGVEHVCCSFSSWLRLLCDDRGAFGSEQGFLPMPEGQATCIILNACPIKSGTLGLLPLSSFSCEHLVEAHGKGLEHDYRCLISLGFPVILNWYDKPHSDIKF